MSDQNSLLPKEIIFPKETYSLLRKTNISVKINSSDIAIFSNVTNNRLIITLQTNSRNVFYFCLRNCSSLRAAISRLCVAANHYLCSEEKNSLYLQAKFGKVQCLICGKKKFFISSRTLFLKIEKSGGFLFFENAPECF